MCKILRNITVKWSYNLIYNNNVCEISIFLSECVDFCWLPPAGYDWYFMFTHVTVQKYDISENVRLQTLDNIFCTQKFIKLSIKNVKPNSTKIYHSDKNICHNHDRKRNYISNDWESCLKSLISLPFVWRGLRNIFCRE